MPRITQVAAGGLLDRREFIASGVALCSAVTIERRADAQEASTPPLDQLPINMLEQGYDDVPYGAPAPQERSIVKERQSGSGGFSIWHSPVATQHGNITPNGLHFSVLHTGIPLINPNDHRLMIHGLVQRPLQFDLRALDRYPMRSAIHFLECAGNSAVNALSPNARDESLQTISGQLSGAEWTGVPVSFLLEEAGIDSAATWVIAEGADGGSLARSIPVHKLYADAFIALYQNGERIRPAQGYPMRLFLPGWEGNACVKWLHRLEVTDQPAFTKDESGLYSEVLASGEIQRFTFEMGVKSMITHPSGRQRLPDRPGFYEIRGLAWSGAGRVVQVEVTADGGRTWANAKLGSPVLDKALTRFTIPWEWNGAATTLSSRATDEYGNRQPTRREWKGRYAAHSFNHYNAIQAWRVQRSGIVKNAYI